MAITLTIGTEKYYYGRDFTITTPITENLSVLTSTVDFEILLTDARRDVFSQTVGTKSAVLNWNDT